MHKPLPSTVAGFILVLVLIGASATTSAVGRAGTREPCWERVVDDWLDDDAIDHHYAAVCYQQALRHLPEDLREYSNIDDAISIALQDSLSGARGSSGSDSRSAGAASGGGGSNGGGADTPRRLQASAQPSRSYYRRALAGLGSTSASSLPMPLLVLAALGMALLIAAAGTLARKRLVARRRR